MFKKIDSIKTTRVPINNLLHNDLFLLISLNTSAPAIIQNIMNVIKINIIRYSIYIALGVAEGFA